MKKIMLKTIKKISFVFLALIVFSCDPGESTVEYGPYTDFRIQGTIIDKTTSNEISNIKVIMQGYELLSNDTGYYDLRVPEAPLLQIYTVQFRDPDGSSNGTYEGLDTIVDFTNIELTNGNGSLYYGEKLLELNVELAPL
jgi:putative lipoprotein (rSAM/lipoprotein system)